MTSPTSRLVAEGVSIWLDDLSRELIETGTLAELIVARDVSGVTTNPTIFNASIGSGSAAYSSQIRELSGRGASVDDAIFDLMSRDVCAAADLLRDTFVASSGRDGRVSMEVSPELAHDTEGTISQAKELWANVGRPNLLIKIPATRAGLLAITDIVGSGISVNATLIFSLERYAEVIAAYLAGLSQAKDAGHEISLIHSVASFFVSRVDVEVDKRLAAVGSARALALTGLAGIANARLAFELFEHAFAADLAQEFRDEGANVQRPLWASTGVKDLSLPDTMYVTELVARGSVNTMPIKTLEATFDHAVILGDSVIGGYAAAHQLIQSLADVGVDFADVTQTLEDEGVAKFIASWRELQDSVARALDDAHAAAIPPNGRDSA